MKPISLKCPLFFTLLPLCGQGFWGNAFPEPRIEYYPKTYVCHKANTAILVDGKLNDKAWSDVKWTDSFVDIEGSLKPDPYYDTKVKMTWDDNYFYFLKYFFVH